MFFEDEKEKVNNGADIVIQDDDTVTWEDVLSNDDDIVIIDKPQPKKTKSTSNNSNVNLGDELELVQNSDDDIDDQELMQILNESDSTSKQKVQNDNSATMDIDEQLADVILDDEQPTLTPRKNKPAKSSPNLLPLLLAILVAALVGYGAYYYTQNFSISQNLDQESIAPPQTPQEEMNNINQEALENRQKEEKTTQEEEKEENIPVVNEEQTEEIQPEKKEPEKKNDLLKEKKQVIVVTPTGRSNPFLPIAKYVTATIPEANVDYDKSGIPRPPETYGEQVNNSTAKMMTIAVSGIMYDEVKPSAIITYDNNDYFVQKGDKLDEYRVLDIARTYVTLALNNNVYKASIGEEFKVSSQFYGNAHFIPESQGGGRQYYSVGSYDSSIEVDRHLRYVSEDEIKINAR